MMSLSETSTRPSTGAILPAHPALGAPFFSPNRLAQPVGRQTGTEAPACSVSRIWPLPSAFMT